MVRPDLLRLVAAMRTPRRDAAASPSIIQIPTPDHRRGSGVLVNSLESSPVHWEDHAMDRSTRSNLQRRDPNATHASAWDRLGKALGVPLTGMTGLMRAVLKDIDEDATGIGWMTPEPSRRRILVSDQLYACADGVARNLVESKLAYLDFEEVQSEYMRFLERGVTHQGRGYAYPKPQSAWDDLYPFRQGAHLASCVRGLGAALDCLGSVIVGVAALPLSILKADYRKSLEILAATAAKAADPGAPVLRELRDQLASNLCTSGPDGWLNWMWGLRHSVVHRGRRMGYSDISVERTILGALLEVRWTLPLMPALSEAEAWHAASEMRASQLHEQATTTLGGLVHATAALVDQDASALLSLWRTRRDAPDLLPQPLKVQWPSVEAVRAPVPPFRGFAPDETAFRIDQTSTGPDGIKRLKAAAATAGDSRWHNMAE